MIKVVVASTNPVKIQAVQEAFTPFFNNSFEVEGFEVSSGIKEQPLSDQETFIGASNRVDNLKKKYPGADFYIGIEGGVDLFGGNYFHGFGWVYILSGDKVSFSRSSTFPLTAEISQMIQEGKELGPITDELFGLKESKKKGGIIGVLTNGVVDRKELYIQPIQFALIPFIKNFT